MSVDVPVVFACVGAEPVRQYLRELERMLRMIDFKEMYKALGEGKKVEVQLADSPGYWLTTRIADTGRFQVLDINYWHVPDYAIIAWRVKPREAFKSFGNITALMNGLLPVPIPQRLAGRNFRYTVEEIIDE